MPDVRKKAPHSKREMAAAKKASVEEVLEEGLLETFPASDPVAIAEPAAEQIRVNRTRQRR
jgi:hypothetical protein